MFVRRLAPEPRSMWSCPLPAEACDLKMIRILLADDHTVMRNGLRLLLERQPDLKVVGEAADGRQAVDIAAAEIPDVVIMDIAMPQLNGVEATRQIVNRNPHAAVVILSMHKDESYVIRS